MLLTDACSDRRESALLGGHRGEMACPHLRHVFPRRDRRQHWGDQPPVLELEPDQQQCADQLGSSLRQPPVDLVNEYGECGDQVTGAFE